MTQLVQQEVSPRRWAPAAMGAVREQALVGAGQIAAGLGNMVFALFAAHVLDPGDFAHLATFLALFTVLGLPGSSISAASAFSPVLAHRLRSSMWQVGLGAGCALTIGAPWIGPALHLPVALVVVLGLSGPSLGVLALERGRLYGRRGHRQLVWSFVTEPAFRLTVGVILALLFGAVGGAFGVVVASYCALEVARHGPRLWSAQRRTVAMAAEVELDEPVAVAPGGASARGVIIGTAVALMVLVVIQNQDLLLANRLLAPAAAGAFAVISTIGGIAAFATLTVPLVLIPRARDGESPLGPALAVTVLVGAAAVALAAAGGGSLIHQLFGDRYRHIASLVVPYVFAMSLLGVARVFAAHRCVRGATRSTIGIALGAALLQAILILEYGHNPRAIAFCTLTATSSLTISLGAASTVELPSLRRILEVVAAAVRDRSAALAVGGTLVVGTALRFAVPRGLWLDEATSVTQARMSYSGMLNNLRTTDVHPPLYFTVLWGTIRWLGSGEMAVRLPSIIAGSLVIPALYGLAKEAYDRRTGIVAAVIGVAAPIMVWYSQEARMYSMMMLFGLIALWAQVRIFKRGGRLSWVVYSLATIALVWTQYFGLLQVMVQQAAFVGTLWWRYRRRDDVKSLAIGWSVSSIVILVALAPLVPFAHQQFIVNQTAGRGFGTPQQVGSATALNGNQMGIYAALANVIWAVWGYHSNSTMAVLGALWPAGMLLALVALGRRRQPVTTLLLAAVLVPGLALFGLGLVKRNLFDIRYLSTAVPVLFVLLARLVTGTLRSVRLVCLATVVLVASLGAALVDQQLNGSNPRLYDFRGALTEVARDAHSGAVLLYDPSDLADLAHYYAPRVRAESVAPDMSAPPGRGKVFVLASTPLMNGQSDAAILANALKVLGQHDHLVHRQQFANVEIWEFS